MSINLDSALSVILEEADHTGLVASCDALCQEVADLKDKISEVKVRLKSMRVRLCAELALLLRKKYPQLNVAVDKKGTKVGYKQKAIYISPDIEGKIWGFKSSDPQITKIFNNKYRKYLILTGSISDLADALGNSFALKYKSIKEQQSESGILLVEGKRSHLTDLVKWADTNG